MYESRIATLKSKLVSERNFHSIMDYLLSAVGGCEEVLEASQPSEQPHLAQIVGAISEQVFGEAATLGDFVWRRIPALAFVHGGGLIGGRLANVVYFEDIQLGMLAIVAEYRSGDMRFARFDLIAQNPLLN